MKLPEKLTESKRLEESERSDKNKNIYLEIGGDREDTREISGKFQVRL